jgi:hypothetical protein
MVAVRIVQPSGTQRGPHGGSETSVSRSTATASPDGVKRTSS